jgi:quercetin dioxygenase-like cupin family protein
MASVILMGHAATSEVIPMALPYLHALGEGRALTVFDSALLLRASGADTDGRYSMYEGTWKPGGFRPLAHVHGREHESFYVLEGTFTFELGPDVVTASAGAFLHAPPGVRHGFANAGDTPARMLFVHAPALDGFFDELESAARSSGPDRSALRHVMERWGMTVDATGP